MGAAAETIYKKLLLCGSNLGKSMRVQANVVTGVFINRQKHLDNLLVCTFEHTKNV